MQHFYYYTSFGPLKDLFGTAPPGYCGDAQTKTFTGLTLEMNVQNYFNGRPDVSVYVVTVNGRVEISCVSCNNTETFKSTFCMVNVNQA